MLSMKRNKTEAIVFLSFSVLLLAGIGFLVYYHVNDIVFYDMPGNCILKILFHLYCPGCGGTRAVDAFLHGQFLKSFLYNPTIVYVAVYFLSYYIPAALKLAGIWKKHINNMIYLNMLVGLLILVVLNFVVRNLLLVYGGIDYIGECISYWQ